MKLVAIFSSVILVVVAACSSQPDDTHPEPDSGATGHSGRSMSLADARRGFETKLSRHEAESDPLDEPPADLFRSVSYNTPKLGRLAAYLSQPPQDGKQHPAILWIFGGFSNSIDATAWEPADADNDQSASAFRKAGIVMMYPSLRGGAGNPGFKESFYGEVDDVLAAAEFLAKQPFVDPDRVYLGGHSTGGTLALLVAESSSRFRAVFAFGPASDVAGYGGEVLLFDFSNPKELKLRSPIHWLDSIKTPVFIFEGSRQGNTMALQAMARETDNPQVHIHEVSGADHFSILAPATRLIARKIVADTGSASSIEFSEQEIRSLMQP